ncbi:MAG TPA: permease [Anaerolineae bacterium]
MSTLNVPPSPLELPDETYPNRTQAVVASPAGPILSKSALWLLLLLLVLGFAIVISDNGLTVSLGDRFQTFVTIFLSIFIEAVPFLLAGAIVAGFIEVFVDRELLTRIVPRHPILAALTGGAMGMVFPVCECGVVPVTRRLYQKGLPQSVGIAFLLAAPVVNPVVVASTYAAFGWGPILYARLGLSFLIASVIGLIFYLADPNEILLPETLENTSSAHHHDHAHEHNHDDLEHSPGQGLWQALGIAGDDFLDMARYLIAGSLLAAGMQTLVPQSALLALGGNAFTSILAMMALAFVLSVCSTVDAFLALAFANSFPPAAILAFLVFGPMVDIKSSLMFLRVFKRRTVAYLILLPFMVTLVVTVYLNLNVRW